MTNKPHSEYITEAICLGESCDIGLSCIASASAFWIHLHRIAKEEEVEFRLEPWTTNDGVTVIFENSEIDVTFLDEN